MKTVKILLTVFVLSSFLTGNLLAEDSGIAALRGLGKAFSQLTKAAKPAVVYVTVEKEMPGFHGSGQFRGGPFEFFGPEFFDRFFRHRSPQMKPGQKPRRER